MVMQMQLTFKGVDEEGNPMRRDTAAVAELMELPEARIKLMLHRALRAIPLVADDEPITVSALLVGMHACLLALAMYVSASLYGDFNPSRMQVIYEDDDLLAVSKPPFLVTAPKHRWQVDLYLSPSSNQGSQKTFAWAASHFRLPLQGGSLVNRVLNYLGKGQHISMTACAQHNPHIGDGVLKWDM